MCNSNSVADIELEDKIEVIEYINRKKRKEILKQIREGRLPHNILGAIIKDFDRHMKTITGTLDNYTYNYGKEVILEILKHYSGVFDNVLVESDHKYFMFIESILQPYIKQNKLFPIPWLEYIHKYMNGGGFEVGDDKVKILKVGFSVDKKGRESSPIPKEE